MIVKFIQKLKNPDAQFLARLRMLSLILPPIAFLSIFILHPILYSVCLNMLHINIPDGFNFFLIRMALYSLVICILLLYSLRVFAGIKYCVKARHFAFSRTRLLLLIAMFLLLPTFYFVGLGGGFLPLFVYYGMLLTVKEGFGVNLFFSIYYTDFYVLLSQKITNKINAQPTQSRKVLILSFTLGLILFISFLPVYSTFGIRGGGMQGNIVDVLKDAYSSLRWRFHFY